MAFGTVTNIGTANNTTGGTLVITVPVGGVPAGALIVVCVSEHVGSLSGSVADTNNTPYSAITGLDVSNQLGRLYYFPNAAALVSGNSITYTKVGTAAAAMSAFYVTGALASSPLDTAVTASASGNSMGPSVTSGTPGVSGELMVAFVASAFRSTYTQDTTNGWAEPPNQATTGTGVTSTAVDGGNQVNAGTGTKTFAPTLGTSVVWEAFVVGFKPVTVTDYTFTLGLGAFTMTGEALTLPASRKFSAGVGAFTLTGEALTLPASRKFSAGVGAFTMTGEALTLPASRKFSAGVGTFTLTGEAIAIGHLYPFAIGAGAFTLTGEPLTLPAGRAFPLGLGTFALTGESLSFTSNPRNIVFMLGNGGFVLVGGKTLFLVRPGYLHGPAAPLAPKGKLEHVRVLPDVLDNWRNG